MKNKLYLSSVKYIILFLISIISLKADTIQIDLSSHINITPATVEVSRDFPTEITIKNENSGSTVLDGQNAYIKYHIPSGSTYNGTYSGTGWSCDSAVDINGDLKCTYGLSLTNGQTSNLLTIYLTAPSSTATGVTGVEAYVTVTATTTDADSSNDTSSTTIEYGKSNLKASKSASKTPLALNEQFTYTITISNLANGTNPTVKARNVTISDTLPSQVSFVSLNDTSWCSESGGTVTCSGVDLDVGDSRSVTITAKAIAGGTGIKNTANIHTDSNNYNGENITKEASVDIDLADIVLTQSLIGGIGSNEAAVDSNVTYQLHIVNNGTSPAENVTIGDTLPSGVTYLGFSSSSNWNCTNNSQDVNCTLLDTNLTKNESYNLNISVTMPSTHGDITNSATASTSSVESDTSNNSSSLLTHVKGADLDVYKTPDEGSTDIGTNYTYTIKVENNGLAEAKNVVIKDILDSRMKYVSDTGHCSGVAVGSSGTLTCNLGNIPTDSNSSFTVFTVTVTMPTDSLNDVTNTASATTDTDQENSSNLSDTATTYITGPNLNITKDANVTEVGLGKPFTYTITVTNVNSANATNADIEDQLPSGVSITDISPDGWSCPSTPLTGTFHCTKSLLAGGTTSNLTFSATAPNNTTGDITNTAKISHSLNSNDGTDTATVNVTGVILDINKVASHTAIAGGLIDYNITVTNTSHSDAQNLTLTDDLSNLGSGYTINSIIGSDGWNCSGSTTLTCTRSSLLAEGASSTLHFNVNVPINASLGIKTNEANVTTTTEPQPTVIGSATTDIQGADIVVIPPTTTTAVANENVVFAVGVRNDGNAVAKDVNITNHFNTNATADFTNIKIDCNGGTNYVAVANNECSLGDIAKNQTKYITISATAPNYDSNFPGNSNIINRSVAVTSTSQSNTSNDNANWGVEIHGADLVVNKTADKSEVAVNGTVTYTINVTNQWEATATNIQITDDTLGSNGDKFTFINGTLNYNLSDWNCNLSSSTHFTCTYQHNLTQNQTTSDITIQAKAPNNINAIDSHRDNKVIVSTDTAEQETATTNEKVVPVTIRGADLNISKTVSPNPAKLNESVTYTINVTNNGLADANNTYVNDTLLSGFTNISTSGCNNDGSSVSGQSVHCTLGNLAQNASKSFTITANAPNTNGDYDNTATTTSDTLEKNTSNNSDTVTLQVRGADLNLDKWDSADPVATNSTYYYYFRVRNEGFSSAFGAEINDTIPSSGYRWSYIGPLEVQNNNWECNKSGNLIHCNTKDPNFEMTPGYNSGAIVRFKVKAPSTTGYVSNTAVVDSNTSEAEPADNSETENTQVINIDLQTGKTVNNTFNPPWGSGENYVGISDNIQYKIYVRNRPISGTTPPGITDVNVTDLIPSNLTNITVTPTSRFTCNNPTNPGDTLFCTMNNGVNNPLTTSDGWVLVATIDSTAPDASHFDVNNENNNFVINKYKAETSFGDQDLNNNAPTTDDGYLHTNTLVRGANMSIVKSVSNNLVGANKPFSYTLAVKNYPRNASPAQHDIPSTDATNIVVKDTLPSDVNFTSASGTDWNCSESSHVVTCNYTGTLAPNISAPDITINVVAPNTDSEILSNEANVTSSTPELVRLLSDNTDTITTTTKGTDITVSKSGPANAGMSDHIIYNITVENTSNIADAKDIYVIDTLPNGATFDGNISDFSHWSSTVETNGSIKFTYNQVLQANTSASFTFSSTLPHYTGIARNHVEAFTSTVETSAPNVADWDTNIIGANLVFKNIPTQGPNPVGAYGRHEYNITIHNQGLSPASDINVTFNFSNAGSNPGWSDVNGTGSGWSCDPYDTTNSKLICHLPSLGASSDSSLLTITSTAPNYNGDINNLATVVGKDDTNATTGESRSVITAVRGSDLKITKYAKDPDPSSDGQYHDINITAGVGKPIDFKFTIKNNNLGVAKDITIKDTFPSGFSDFNITSQGDWNCSFSGLTLICIRTLLQSNADAQDVLVSAKTPVAIGTVTNTVDINTSTKEVDNTNNTNNVQIKLEGATLNADLNASKTEVAMGETFTYILHLTNTGRNDGVDINVTDTLPADLTYIDSNGSDSGWICSQSSSTITCNQPLISAYNGESILKLNVKAPQNQIGVYQNSVDINSSSIENSITLYAPDIQVIGADLAVDINATPNRALEDRNVTYELHVKDVNISTAHSVVLKQTFSEPVNGLYITSGASDCNLTDANQSVTCSYPTLNFNEDKNITVVATMPSTNLIISHFTSTVEATTISKQEDNVNHTAHVDIIVNPIIPVANYRFEECTKNDTVKDSISNIDGTYESGAKPLSHIFSLDHNDFAPPGRTAKFDGNNDYVNIPNSSKLQITHNQTICIWLKPHSFSSRKNPYEKSYGGEGTITQEKSGSLTYYYGTHGNNGSPYQGFGSSQTLHKYYWNHACIVRDLDNMKLKWYIDGSLTNTTNAQFSNAATSTQDINIGKGYAGKFKGYIDEVEIYNIALDDKAVKDIYNFEKAGKNYDGTDRNETLCGVDLRVTKTANPYPVVGAESGLDYTITIKNLSDEPLTTGFTLSDIMPSSIPVGDINLSLPSDITCTNGQDFNCTLPESNYTIMSKNDTRVITVHTLSPNSDGETLVNSAQVVTGVAGNPGQPDQDISNNGASATVKTKGTDLKVTKTAVLDNNGSNLIHYTINVKNISSVTVARGVKIKDSYDSRLSVVTMPNGDCSTYNGYFTCNIPDLNVGEEYILTTTMVADVNGSSTGIYNDVNVTSHTVDANLSNNSDSVVVDLNVSGENIPVRLKTGFRRHATINSYSNMVAIGNTILKPNNYTGSEKLTDINTSYIDIDGNQNTYNSSSAGLNIPENNITIEYAGLYWGGHIKGKDNNSTLSDIFNKVRLTLPSGNSYVIIGGDQENGDILSDDNTTGFFRFKRDSGSVARLYYASEANVTSLIRDEYQNSGTINGDYIVSDLNVSFGLDNVASFIPDDSSFSGWAYFTSGFFGGWELVVVYSVNHREYRSIRYKNSTLYDGYEVMMPRFPGQSVSLDINVSGFLTPSSGDIESSLFSMVFAGDKELPFESMSVDDASGHSTLVKEEGNNTNNIFNDTISLKNLDNSPITKSEDLSYNPGIDLDQFDTTNYLNNSQTSTTIHVKVREDINETSPGSHQYAAQYAFVNMLAFNTEIYTPDFIDSYKECFKKKYPNSLANNDWVPCSEPTPVLHRGSIIKYRVTLINSGTDDAVNVNVTDVLPKEVDFNGTCSSSTTDINATYIFPLPDGAQNFSDPLDLDNNYSGSSLRAISGYCMDPRYDYNETVRDECIKDIKAILVDGNTTTPLNTIPDGNGENLSLIDTSYSGANCSTDGNITTLTFNYPYFGKSNVAWIDFYTRVNSKAVLGKSFENAVSIDFTNQTLQDAGINNLQTQQTEPVESGTIYFDWSHISGLIRDPGRNSVGAKIVNKPFDLNVTLTGISGLDIDTEGNTTMTLSNLRLVDIYDGNLEKDISGSIVNDTIPVNSASLSWITSNTNYNQASKKIGFKFDLTLSYKDHNETKHYPQDFSNISTQYAGDLFTTRPKSYSLSMTGGVNSGSYIIIKAAHSSTLAVEAIDNNGSDSFKYDTVLSKTNGINISLDSNFSTNPACISINELNITDLTFNNGISNNAATKYSEVGVLKFDLADQNWTTVDKNNSDCIVGSGSNIPDSNGLIGCNVEGNSTSIVYIPDHFDFNDTNIGDFDNDFTYMVTDPTTDQVYGHANTHIISKNLDDNTTKFFSSSCFADKVDINLSYNVDSLSINDLNVSIANESNLTNISSSNSLLATDNNFSTAENNDSFTDGTAPLNLRIYADRNKTTPLNPALVSMQKINGSIDNYLGITGANVAPVDKDISADGMIHYIYGRIYAPNYSSDNDVIDAIVYYQGYCKDCNKSKYPSLGAEGINSIYWYENGQTRLDDGNISNFAQPVNTKISITPPSSTTVNNGTENHTITYTGTTYPYSERVDMNASSWLIYSPFDANASVSSFYVNFSKYNDWAGVGNTGKTVDLNISTKSSKRIEW